MIQKLSSDFKVTKMCQIMGISRSGYYAGIKRPESKQSLRRKALLTEIQDAYEESFGIYGAPRITAELHHNGTRCSRGIVARIMRENGICSKIRKKFRVTTDSKHDLPVFENILNREFWSDFPNWKWVSDITYIWTQQGWLYLAGILDLYDGAIVGWAMDITMPKELAIRALLEACTRRNPEPGLILHSDRGSQYCSAEYQKEIADRGFICSMSRRGNCWDNAPMESFWGKLKTEWLYGRTFKTRAEARESVFEYIELFYNRKRLRSVNGYIAPLDMTPAA